MKKNLSVWALTHQNLVLYFFVLTLFMGVFGYYKLGQAEDPPFTFKVMLVQVQWPGASTQEMGEQVVDRDVAVRRLGKLRQILVNGVVDVEFPLPSEAENRRGSELLGERGNAERRVERVGRV